MSVALHEPAPSLRFSWVRDQRHTTARAADDLMAWLSWLELGGASEETLAGYEWSLANSSAVDASNSKSRARSSTPA